ncbi:hypothetical protein NQ318_015939 [Aromia moschata]|uniref:PiggyBac transposable element-derived protein domain-containing protein n=1 Tax=Aromia moschata TaxID=1265417 RepID=A0AAV8XJ36_9CUCU|nr:hypothetical protein NQ318_015939 [Aromia moschata]
METDKVRTIKWVDKRPVLMITLDPSHKTDLIETGKCNKKGVKIKKPKCILDYNIAMKGVDLSDQMSSYCTVLRKSLKWYRNVCFELLFGTCVVNAWVIYCSAKHAKISMMEFRKTVGKIFVYEQQKNAQANGTSVLQVRRRSKKNNENA